MSALLRSFAFDEPTTAYLQKALQKRKEEAFGQMMFNAYQFEDHEAAPLQGLPDGDYTLVIGADLENDTMAHLSLMNAETQEIVKKVEFDLNPIIQSAIMYSDEYSQAWGFDSDDEDEQQAATQSIEEVEKIRYACLTDLLAPYVQTHPVLQGELLEALDFLTGYYIEDRLTDLSPETTLKDRLNDPLTKFIPPSHTLH